MEKHCPQCGENKPTTEFYKNKSSKDELQRCCKICCNFNSKKFRENRPEYYWGTDGYFTTRYKETIEYQIQVSKANKSGKIYLIETPDGIYIGSTKRNFNLRLHTHMADYKNKFLRQGINVIPLLYKSFSNYSIDEVKTFLRNAKLIEEFEGDKYETHRKESYWMEHYKRMGLTLLNVRDSWGKISQKNSEKILK
jgi:predicted GIY-YIG superfamily endonuclease